MVEVYRSGNPYEAHLVRHALDEQGIRSLIVGEALTGWSGENTWGLINPISIVVPAADAEQAIRIVSDLPARLQSGD
jgi:hypothetical protein